MLGKTISTNSLILGAFAAVTAGLIALTFQGTKERISAAERAAKQKALFEIFPANTHTNDLLESTTALPKPMAEALHVSEGTAANIVKNNDQTVGVIVPATAPDGYSGDIHMIIGINADGTLAGVRILSHKETPGLGDKVDLAKSDWVLSFNNKSLQNPNIERWAVKKDGGDFDAFTGATITPRAVVNQVKNALESYQANGTLLLKF